jgi:hypothetical protein
MGIFPSSYPPGLFFPAIILLFKLFEWSFPENSPLWMKDKQHNRNDFEMAALDRDSC